VAPSAGLAALRRAIRRLPGGLRATLAIVGALILLGAAWLYWISRPPRTVEQARARVARRAPAPEALNVVVVTLDTLRADRLGCYGFGRVETPNIDALAADGVLFEQATSTVPMTLPSHVSIFTGLDPPHHGVRDNGGFILDPAKTTLAERLKGAGYATGAFVAAWVLESRWGLDQGFDEYSDRFDLSKYKVVNLGTVQKKGDEVMDDALRWMDSVKSRKFFSWIHLYDPHTPYEAPEPFASRYPGHKYLAEVAYTDHVVGRLTRWLRDAKLWDRTLVVLLADHGESLGEHGEATHTFFVYDATVHVPLIVRTPWGDRGRSAAQVSTVDVMPTVLDLVGLPAEAGIDGHSLVLSVLDPRSDAGHAAYAETYFPRFHYGWQQLRALRDGRFKYIEAPNPELYDLGADPGETRNIYKANSRRAEDMRLVIESLAGPGHEAAPDKQSLDPETLQRLAALGYVGSAPVADPKAVLPDPKDKIGLFSRIGEAKAAAREERLEDAVTLIRGVLAEDPRIIDAQVVLGSWLHRLKRTDEAIASFKEALAIKPDHEDALSQLADLYRELGRNDAAIEGYRSVLRVEPRKPQTWYQLAALYLDLGREKQAEETFRQALEHNPKMGAAYNSLGAIAWSRGQVDEAERLVRMGLEMEPDVRTGHFNLARVSEARKSPDEAERLYRKELELYSDHGRARFNLAQLRRERGDEAGYVGELRACVDKAPDFGPCYFFLAREALGAGRLDEAADVAARGIEKDKTSEVAPLGHYVLADVYSRRGDAARSRQEAAAGKALEARIKAGGRRGGD
jgi:arylsulfatase A-like enzyme/Tfp pilus assembly protein PilF